MNRALLLLLMTFLLATSPSVAQRLAGALSERQVAVDSNFVGQTLTLFGNIEPPIGAADQPVAGPFQVVVVVTGPMQNRVVRQQTNKYLIWLNTESETFYQVPSYKWVFSSAPLETISDNDVFNANHILLTSTGEDAEISGNGDPALFQAELVRLMTDKKLYGINETGVQFRSPTLYSVRIELPGDVPNGTFLAQTFLFKNQAVMAHKAESFIVRKAGLERLLGESARDDPLLYGLVCVFLALITGWLGGVLFKR